MLVNGNLVPELPYFLGLMSDLLLEMLLLPLKAGDFAIRLIHSCVESLFLDFELKRRSIELVEVLRLDG